MEICENYYTHHLRHSQYRIYELKWYFLNSNDTCISTTQLDLIRRSKFFKIFTFTDLQMTFTKLKNPVASYILNIVKDNKVLAFTRHNPKGRGSKLIKFVELILPGEFCRSSRFLSLGLGVRICGDRNLKRVIFLRNRCSYTQFIALSKLPLVWTGLD